VIAGMLTIPEDREPDDGRRARANALGMLLLDAAFCECFFLTPRSSTWEAGLPLFPIEVVEVDALWRLSRIAIARSGELLDPSLRGLRKIDPGSQR
jgi:hypothetical protein